MNKTEIEIPQAVLDEFVAKAQKAVEREYRFITDHSRGFAEGYETALRDTYRHLKSLPDVRDPDQEISDIGRLSFDELPKDVREWIHRTQEKCQTKTWAMFEMYRMMSNPTNLEWSRQGKRLYDLIAEITTLKAAASFPADKPGTAAQPPAAPTGEGEPVKYINICDQQQWQEMSLEEKSSYLNPEWEKCHEAQRKDAAWIAAFDYISKFPPHDFYGHIRQEAFVDGAKWNAVAHSNNSGACRWVKADERLPESDGRYACKADGEYFTKYLGPKYIGDKNIFWLEDLPSSPSTSK
jgi:hypothetical protein